MAEDGVLTKDEIKEARKRGAELGRILRGGVDKSNAEQKVVVDKFKAGLIDNIEDLDPEFSKVINEHYWDLI